ncbi:MAG: DNA topoisomerase, partial [Candidatus Staskawiczbacteria bacterium]
AGIGTEATRAGIIKEIITKEFLIENKKFLIPSETAYTLIDSLPDELTYPDTTAIWEMNFDKITEGGHSMDDFMKEQTEFVTNLCKVAAGSKVANNSAMYCPKCKEGTLIKRSASGKGKSFSPFWGCTRYPECRATYADNNNAPRV